MTRALAAEHDVEVVETGQRGDATKLAREAAEVGIDVVVVLAGDGTLNEAACGLIGTHTALARAAGWVHQCVRPRARDPARPDRRRPTQLLRRSRRGSFTRIGVGAATQPTAPIGGSCSISGSASTPPWSRRWKSVWYLKRYLAHPAFAIAAVDTWLRRYDRARGSVPTSSARREGQQLGAGPYVVVSNADPYTYVLRRRPRSRVAPPASTARSRVTILQNLARQLVVRGAASRASRPGASSRPRPTSCSAPTSTRMIDRRRSAVPVAGRRRLPRARRPSRRPLRRPTP